MRPSSAAPAIHGDPDQLGQRRRELLLAGPPETFAEDRDDLGLRPPVHEDDEAEAETLLVGAVQPRERLENNGIVVAALLACTARGELGRADRRMRVEHLLHLLVAQLARDLACHSKRILPLGEALDEARPSFEELRELLDAQLPR